VGDTGLIRLRDGSTLFGEIVALGEGGEVVRFPTGEKALLRPGSIVRLEQHARVASDPRTAIEGFASQVLAPTPMDPGRTRYLYAPSAFMLAGGEGSISLSQGTQPTLAAGLTDFLTLSVGYPLTVTFADTFGPAATVSAALGFEVLPLLHLSGGVQTVFARAGNAGSLYGTVTFGTPDANLTLHGGRPPADAHELGRFGDIAVAGCGALRLASWLTLVAESWVAPADRGQMLNAVALRFFARWLVLEAGVVRAPIGGGVRPFLLVAIPVKVGSAP